MRLRKAPGPVRTLAAVHGRARGTAPDTRLHAVRPRRLVRSTHVSRPPPPLRRGDPPLRPDARPPLSEERLQRRALPGISRGRRATSPFPWGLHPHLLQCLRGDRTPADRSAGWTADVRGARPEGGSVPSPAGGVSIQRTCRTSPYRDSATPPGVSPCYQYLRDALYLSRELTWLA